MKIIGFVYTDGRCQMVMKGDSCLLNGRKPFFIPDWCEETGVTPCLILRVSRLGKEIQARFARRYYDAIAPGADFVALDAWREAAAQHAPWTRAIAFDYSLAIGEWTEDPAGMQEALDQGTWVLTPEEAVEQASKVMTIRQGDILYIQARERPRRIQKEDIVRAEIAGEEKLYCRIK